MTERRTPRAHLQGEAIADEQGDLPPVAPMLVEYLERKFPMRLSLSTVTSPDGVLADQARQFGNQEVIDLLRNLTRQGA